MRRQLRDWLPLIYTKTALRWDDIETMPHGELDALLERLRR